MIPVWMEAVVLKGELDTSKPTKLALGEQCSLSVRIRDHLIVFWYMPSLFLSFSTVANILFRYARLHDLNQVLKSNRNFIYPPLLTEEQKGKLIN